MNTLLSTSATAAILSTHTTIRATAEAKALAGECLLRVANTKQRTCFSPSAELRLTLRRHVRNFHSMDSDLAQFIDLVIAEQVPAKYPIALLFHTCPQGSDVPIVLFSHRYLPICHDRPYLLPQLSFARLSMGAMLALRYLSSPGRSPRVRAAFMSVPPLCP
jgi:alpha-beta hydrolase superfamily lysophospholipase